MMGAGIGDCNAPSPCNVQLFRLSATLLVNNLSSIRDLDLFWGGGGGWLEVVFFWWTYFGYKDFGRTFLGLLKSVHTSAFSILCQTIASERKVKP